MNNIYTVEEVASILKLSKRSIYTYIKDGKLKAKLIGNKWRITEENLNKFMQIEDD
jgi:excisionase family DNA binding protein